MEVCQRIAGFRATHARLLCYTLLSFLAKFGASIPDKEILGGHTGRMKSVLTYSRDSLASPLRVLNNMLERIRQGFFDPNATRSGMMKADVKVEVLSVEEDDEQSIGSSKIWTKKQARTLDQAATPPRAQKRNKLQ